MSKTSFCSFIIHVKMLYVTFLPRTLNEVDSNTSISSIDFLVRVRDKYNKFTLTPSLSPFQHHHHARPLFICLFIYLVLVRVYGESISYLAVISVCYSKFYFSTLLFLRFTFSIFFLSDIFFSTIFFAIF
jgi:hypothetical protein